MTAPHENSVTQWIEAVKGGDEDAAARLWERYFHRLVGLARRKLGGVPRRVSDEEDVALSVFDSLCQGATRGRFHMLKDRDDLWKLLVTIACQKAVDMKRRDGALKRGGGRVRGDSVFESADHEGRATGFADIAGADPTPEFLALLSEQHGRLLAKLRDDTLRNIAIWKMEGFTNDEIASKLAVSTRAVERKLKLIREKWSRELSE